MISIDKNESCKERISPRLLEDRRVPLKEKEETPQDKSRAQTENELALELEALEDLDDALQEFDEALASNAARLLAW